jgi:hypothetical protein
MGLRGSIVALLASKPDFDLGADAGFLEAVFVGPLVLLVPGIAFYKIYSVSVEGLLIWNC